MNLFLSSCCCTSTMLPHNPPQYKDVPTIFYLCLSCFNIRLQIQIESLPVCGKRSRILYNCLLHYLKDMPQYQGYCTRYAWLLLQICPTTHMEARHNSCVVMCGDSGMISRLMMFSFSTYSHRHICAHFITYRNGLAYLQRLGTLVQS